MLMGVYKDLAPDSVSGNSVTGGKGGATSAITRSISFSAIFVTQMVAVGKQIKMAAIVMNGSVPSQKSSEKEMINGRTMIKRKGNKSLRQSILGVAL
jgi:hypothetical protein